MTEKTATEIRKTPDGQPNMLEKAICLAVRIGRLGNRRKVPTSQVEVDADKALITVSKTLLDSRELKAVQHLDGEIRKYLYSRCLPSLFRDGIYLLPIALVEEVEARLQEFVSRRSELADEFCRVYPAKIQIAAGRLKTLFDPTDYPSAAQVRDSFLLDWQYISFGVPGKLEEISRDIFAREREKAAEKWAEATDAVQQVLRANMADLVEHLVERLTGKDGAKPKVFRNTVVSNMREFLATFAARNITDDAELESLVDRAGALLDGVDPELLRKDSGTRKTVRKEFGEIKAALDSMLVDRPGRAISFEDV